MANNLIGRLCVKTCGRESNRECVIIDEIDNTFVLIDGNVKRRRCNIHHLEMLNDIIKIKQGASTEDVKKAMENAGILLKRPRPKEQPTSEKPKKQRKVKEKKPEKETKKKQKEEPEKKQAKAKKKEEKETKKASAKKQSKKLPKK